MGPLRERERERELTMNLLEFFGVGKSTELWDGDLR